MEDRSGHQKHHKRTSNIAADIAKAYVEEQDRKAVSNEQIEGNRLDHNSEEKNFDKFNEGIETIDKEFLQEEEILRISSKFEEIAKERDDLKEQVKRIAAELENLRRRCIKEKQEMIDYANERLLFKMLPLIDDMESAIEAGKKATDVNSILTGIEIIYNKVLSTFEEAGVKQMENPMGAEFDVNFHEAVATTPSDLPEGYIAFIIQPGYMMQNKVLRHAKVVTSNGSSNTNIKNNIDVSQN